MELKSFRAAPIAVGGLGGSGTRVVARILEALGVHMGRDRNREEDCLTFTLLFKRKGWADAQLAGSGDELALACRVLAKGLLGHESLDRRERAFVWRAAREIAWRGHDPDGNGRGAWAFVRALHILRAPRLDPGGVVSYGFKDPNSHVFLEALAGHFTGLRYVLVVRSGLDMAFSRNTTQLRLWGERFGVTRGEPSEAAQLEYWLRANSRSVELGRSLLGERFTVLDYERLCTEPRGTVRTLARRLGIEVEEGRLDAGAALVAPRSRGRHRAHDPSRLDARLVGEALSFEAEILGREVGSLAAPAGRARRG